MGFESTVQGLQDQPIQYHHGCVERLEYRHGKIPQGASRFKVQRNLKANIEIGHFKYAPHRSDTQGCCLIDFKTDCCSIQIENFMDSKQFQRLITWIFLITSWDFKCKDFGRCIDWLRLAAQSLYRTSGHPEVFTAIINAYIRLNYERKKNAFNLKLKLILPVLT